MGSAVERCWEPIFPGPQSREPSPNPLCSLSLMHGIDTWAVPSARDTLPPFPLISLVAVSSVDTQRWRWLTQQSGPCPALASITACVCFQALTDFTVLVSELSSKKIKSSIFPPF